MKGSKPLYFGKNAVLSQVSPSRKFQQSYEEHGRSSPSQQGTPAKRATPPNPQQKVQNILSACCINISSNDNQTERMKKQFDETQRCLNRLLASERGDANYAHTSSHVVSCNIPSSTSDNVSNTLNGYNSGKTGHQVQLIQ